VASGGNIVTQVQRQYNGLGQLTREWQSHSGAVNTSTTPSVQYAYSEMASGANHSRLTSVMYPSGYVLTYNYSSDLNGSISRLSSLSDSTGTLESYDYLGLGTVVRRSHPQPDLDLTFLGTGPGSGGDQYVGLDSFGRVVDQHWKHGSTSTDRFTYSYDRNGNRQTKGNSLNSNFNESYSYDGLNQLSSFARSNGDSQSWDYDALGNWDSVTTNGTTQTRSANAQNEITSISGAATPTYDANGNMTGDETGKQFVYDAWNRLKVVKNSSGTTLKTYQYDAINRRVAEVVGSDTTDLYYSSQWQVLEERVNGVGKYRYVWSPVYVDAMVLRDRLDASDRLWVQQDANFNVTAIVDDNGNVVERYAYEPYGKASAMNASWSATSSNAFGWQYLHQGGRRDTASWLYHFRNRDFSSDIGHWTTIDPMSFEGGSANFYIFGANSSVNNTDPLGLVPTVLAIQLVRKPIRGSYGAFFWPVVFKLDQPSDACLGGWVLQHVVWTTEYKPLNKDKKIIKRDYWEAWRVEPNTFGPTPTTIEDRGLANYIESTQYVNVPIKDIRANDYYFGGKYPLSTGRHEYRGKVYYFDGIGAADLPATWTKQHNNEKPAGNLPSITVKGNESDLRNFFIRSTFRAKAILGPYPHDIVAKWSPENVGGITNIPEYTPSGGP
jgi:RHS repeat-associated protein